MRTGFYVEMGTISEQLLLCMCAGGTNALLLPCQLHYLRTVSFDLFSRVLLSLSVCCAHAHILANVLSFHSCRSISVVVIVVAG